MIECVSERLILKEEENRFLSDSWYSDCEIDFDCCLWDRMLHSGLWELSNESNRNWVNKKVTLALLYLWFRKTLGSYTFYSNYLLNFWSIKMIPFQHLDMINAEQQDVFRLTILKQSFVHSYFLKLLLFYKILKYYTNKLQFKI